MEVNEMGKKRLKSGKLYILRPLNGTLSFKEFSSDKQTLKSGNMPIQPNITGLHKNRVVG